MTLMLGLLVVSAITAAPDAGFPADCQINRSVRGTVTATCKDAVGTVTLAKPGFDATAAATEAVGGTRPRMFGEMTESEDGKLVLGAALSTTMRFEAGERVGWVWTKTENPQTVRAVTCVAKADVDTARARCEPLMRALKVEPLAPITPEGPAGEPLPQVNVPNGCRPAGNGLITCLDGSRLQWSRPPAGTARGLSMLNRKMPGAERSQRTCRIRGGYLQCELFSLRRDGGAEHHVIYAQTRDGIEWMCVSTRPPLEPLPPVCAQVFEFSAVSELDVPEAPPQQPLDAK